MAKLFSINQSISVVVPVYNERGILPLFHKKLTQVLEELNLPYEIIYVDDHSTDGTLTYLQRLAKKVSREHRNGRTRIQQPIFGQTQVEENVRVFQKTGKRGKAFSLVQGFTEAKGSICVMIDGDLQYPPEAIPEMINKLDRSDIVVANRKKYDASRLRKFMSHTFRRFFGTSLFGLTSDIQSGLKVFKREVFETVQFVPDTPWTFDLEFLFRAKQAGFIIADHDITFSSRTEGKSHVKILATSIEIGLNALLVKARKLPPTIFPPKNTRTMRGAGVGFKKHKYITHTTLPFSLSAAHTFTRGQIAVVFVGFLITLAGLMIAPLLTAQILVSILSMLYFIDAVFNFLVVYKSLKNPEEIVITDEELRSIDEKSLPRYSILCPLYKEAHVVPQFLSAISKLEWPKEKLDVMFLLEEDDIETIEAFNQMTLPFYARTVIVPHSMPKTKPKACNYGMSYAKGEYLVIYDAEDIPDPLQLKKAYVGFQKVPDAVKCLQAKLNFYNKDQNLLTRFFTLEYSLWFDLTLTGLQGLRSTLPLGGTSNHFKTQNLRELEGWDPFNVTEDADLGIRLFQRGFQTAIIDSTTYEEATSNVRNWLRQRSRWIKGYMQTYLVHMRHSFRSIREKGLKHHLIFQLTVGGKLLFILLNPFMWIVTLLYFTMYPIVGATIEAIYVPPVSYLAVFSWIFGNFLFLYYYMIGAGKRNQWELLKYVAFVPLYWLLMSMAALIAFYQLLFKPHYWEKTVHGFHLAKAPIKPAASTPLPSLQPLPAYAENIVTQQKTGIVPRAYASLGQVIAPVLLRGLPLFLLLILDLVLAQMFLPENEAQIYTLLSIVGKTLFLGSQLGAYVSVRLQRITDEKSKFYRLLFFSFLFNWVGFVLVGLEGETILPLIAGNMFDAIVPYLSFYTFAFMCFGIAYFFGSYHLKEKRYTFVMASLLIVALQGVFIGAHHASIEAMVKILAYLGGGNLLMMFFLQGNTEFGQIVENNIRSFFGVFRHSSYDMTTDKQLKILVFNWRDTKHIYGGGAEVYVHELAKRWVQEGNQVTLFCGNDNRNESREIVEGVEVIRRGGTYSVYIFALLYYIFKFAGKYDVIVDCENGIPFFSPLFSTKPVVLLIHHVHQEVFRTFLRFPLNHIAALLEGKLMPLVYRDKPIITVSESSRKEILKLGFTHEDNIQIIPNGVVTPDGVYEKTVHPSFIYLGRLKEYKNIDIAIKAFAQVRKIHKDARFSIVGAGESYMSLKALVARFGISHAVDFVGKVSEEEKVQLLAQSWVMVQPSAVEGWGITVIEANAVGTPVIASYVNGLKDSVIQGETGVLVEVRNIRKLTKTMNELIEDAAYRQRLSQSAQIWAKNFDWDKSAETFSLALQKTVQGKRYKPVFQEILFPMMNK